MAMNARRARSYLVAALMMLLFAVEVVSGQTPSPALLVLEKSDRVMAIVDPGTLKIVGRVPAGDDPHEIVASADGKIAYISNYGGSDSNLNTISVVDVVAQKPLPAINLGALHSAHGLAYGGGKLYFTAETNKAFGRYDPVRQTIDWILGTGQDRTHMIFVSPGLDRIVTSNVNSGTISIIEQVMPSFPPQGGPPAGNRPPGSAPGGGGPGGPRKTWEVTSVPAGRGSEGFDVSPDGKEIWAANAQDGTVTVIDVASKTASQTFPVSANHANRLKFTPDGKRVLISGLGGGPPGSASPGSATGSNLVILDAATHREIKQFNLGGGSAGILILADGSRAFVAVSEKDKVAVIDLKTLEISGEIPTGRQPDGLAWAPRN
jgi:YVTN family beta-propeller protein